MESNAKSGVENTIDKCTTISVETSEAQPDDENVTTNTEDQHEVNRDTLPGIKELTIKNLDTGEQFIIGENDPDFDFDTFELRRGVEATPILAPKQNDGTLLTPDGIAIETAAKNERMSWWDHLLNVIYGSRQAKKKEEQSKLAREFSVVQKPKTPFTKLSNFKFRKELGRGAFGRVLLAEAKVDGNLYALKIITKKNMRSSDKRQAKAERDILHAMTLKAPHPFTSGLKFAFQSENNLYLGMDYIPGGNLRELIKKFKYLPEDWVKFYAAELVLAIAHLHSLNVLYRDIKPHNVMIDARGHVILIDFGLSKQEIIHPRGALSLVGTPDYSAPEVLKTGVQQIEAHNRERASAAAGKKVTAAVPRGGNTATHHRAPAAAGSMGYGKAADWWSLGIMIYEMLSGTPTFRGSDLRQTYQKILYADLEFHPEDRFSLAAKLLLTGMIQRDPAVRMGAWENPPQDIMSAPFFHGIQWDAIYERRYNGPYIPEAPVFNSSSAPGGTERKNSITNNNNNNNTVNKAAGQERRGSGGEKQQKKEFNKNQDNTNLCAAAISIADDNEEEEDEDSSVCPELRGMRDSVFIRSHEAVGNNLLDWSFIDEKVLVDTVKQQQLQQLQKEEENRAAERATAITKRRKSEKSDMIAEINHDNKTNQQKRNNIDNTEEEKKQQEDDAAIPDQQQQLNDNTANNSNNTNHDNDGDAGSNTVDSSNIDKRATVRKTERENNNDLTTARNPEVAAIAVPVGTTVTASANIV